MYYMKNSQLAVSAVPCVTSICPCFLGYSYALLVKPLLTWITWDHSHAIFFGHSASAEHISHLYSLCCFLEIPLFRWKVPDQFVFKTLSKVPPHFFDIVWQALWLLFHADLSGIGNSWRDCYLHFEASQSWRGCSLQLVALAPEIAK